MRFHLANFFKNNPIPTRTKAGLAILAITFIIFAFPRVNDPDFGWHLKSGQIYSETHRIPVHDIFSYTMSGYPWVNQTYASDAFYYLLYQWGGQTTILLSFFFLCLAVITFLIVFPRTFPYVLQSDERLFAGFIALLTSRIFFGIRSQVFDWLGFLLVILIWNRYKKTNMVKTLWWCIPLFFFWANIHAGFLIGFAFLGFMFCFDVIDQLMSGNIRQWFSREKYQFFSAIGIVLTACAVTLINPYGIHLYQDIIRTLSDKTIYETIAEWRPGVVSSIAILPFTIYMFSFVFLLMLYQREKSLALRDAMLIIIFLLFALSSVRLIPFFILLSLPFFAHLFAQEEFFLPMLMLFIIPSFLIGAIINKPESLNQSIVPDKNIFYGEAPMQAFAYLRAHPMKGNMFNDYGWGGTIIWSFPEYKTFIDGRMSYWKLNDRNIFKDYSTIQNIAQDWDEKISDYGIDWFIIKKSTSLAAVLETLPAWQKQYDDEYAVIFVRKE